MGEERSSYYRRLSLPKRAEVYLEPLIERAQAGVAAVAKAVEGGELRVDDELHLTPLAAEEQDVFVIRQLLTYSSSRTKRRSWRKEIDNNFAPVAGMSTTKSDTVGISQVRRTLWQQRIHEAF